MKRCLALVMALVLVLAAAWIPSVGTKVEAASFTDMNQSQITEAMGLGWNLGNQLEANLNGTPSETAWGNPTITSSIFAAVKAAGFDTVRIPVSWLSYIGSDYTVNSTWMARVKEVVDMAIAADLYVVINVHGDGYSTVTGGWLLPGASDQTTIVAKFKSLWTQIATTFKDYDHHLIFEGMNEIGADANYDWETVNNYYTNINTYNQTFIDAVRATGGNNEKRWLIITGWNTNIDYTTNEWLNFELPTDSYNSSPRIMVSVHYYSPWEFCGNESYDVVNWGSSATSSVATWGNEDYMIEQIALCYDNFVSQGYPVFIGEFGCIDKGNTAMRIYWAETFVELCKNNGCIPVWWDNGYNGTYGFGLFDRSSCTQTQSSIISAMVAAMGGSSSTGTTTTTAATTTTTTQAAATTTTTTTTTASSGSSSNADNYVITINGTSALKYIVVNGYHLSVADGSGTYWENAAVTNGSATVYVPKANAYSLTIDFKSEQWGNAIASWSGDITSDITLTFDGSNVTASTGSSGTTTTTTTKAPTTTTTTTTTTKATTTTTKATTTTTKATTTTTTTTTKATTTTTQASSSSSDNYAVTIKTSGSGSSLGYIMIQGYHLSVANGEGTYWENVAAGDGTVIYIPKAQSWEITVNFKTSEWGSSSASWTGTVTSDMTLTFDGSSVSAS